VDRSPAGGLQLARGRSIGSTADSNSFVIASDAAENKGTAVNGQAAVAVLKEEASPDAALDKLLKKKANVEERRSKIKSSANFKSAVLSQIEGDGDVFVPSRQRDSCKITQQVDTLSRP
jgi:hypothetical protein